MSVLRNEKKITDSLLMDLRESAINDSERIKMLEDAQEASRKRSDKQQKKLKVGSL